ncbi:MAG TPA: hypothetical protein VIY52_09510 [Streptosporangiaceae bacterium]
MTALARREAAGARTMSYGRAERLGGQPAQFRGGHGGFGSHPDGFAARLREVLAGGQY